MIFINLKTYYITKTGYWGIDKKFESFKSLIVLDCGILSTELSDQEYTTTLPEIST